MSEVVVEEFNGSAEQFRQRVITEEKLVVAEFGATWCGPCIRLNREFTKLAAEYPDVLILIVDIDKNRELGSHYKVSSIPDIRFFKAQGTNIDPVATVTGCNLGDIRAAIEQYK